MKNKYLILSLLFVLTGVTAQSQLFVDAYYGYNHSNETYTLGDEFYSLYYVSYWGELTDTVYTWNDYLKDSVMYVIREFLGYERESFPNKHNFYEHQAIGLDIGYEINDYLRSYLSYNFINLNNSLDIKTESLTDTYKEGEISSRSMYYNEITYKIQKLSLGFSVTYPCKKFEPELFLSGDSYYTKIKHKYWDKGISYELDMENEVLFYKWEYSGISYGFTTGIGLSYNIYQHFSIFSKFGYSRGELLISRGKITDSVYEGFVPEDLEPEDIPFKKIPFNGYNFRVGLRYKFGN